MAYECNGDTSRLPPWLKTKLPKYPHIRDMQSRLRRFRLHTVCESARCPNIGECFSRGTATFMILGNQCTRNCRFCAVEKGVPEPVDPLEPKRIARMVEELKLRHAVITSVTRDDLPDQGAHHFAATVNAIHQRCPETTVEVLPSDFWGRRDLIQVVVESKPAVYNHNIETVRRLQPQIRPQADYERSLSVLAIVKELNDCIVTKSGLMVGLGETDEEVIETMRELRRVGCDIVTIGQYLQPTRRHWRVMRYVPPEVFEQYASIGEEMGFMAVVAGPFVRSSYRAEEALKRACHS